MQEVVVRLTVERYAHGGHVVDDGPCLEGETLLCDACEERVVNGEIWFYALCFHLARETEHWDEPPGMAEGLRFLSPPRQLPTRKTTKHNIHSHHWLTLYHDRDQPPTVFFLYILSLFLDSISWYVLQRRQASQLNVLVVLLRGYPLSPRPVGQGMARCTHGTQALQNTDAPDGHPAGSRQVYRNTTRARPH